MKGRDRLLVVVDQGVSGLSNIAPMLVLAKVLGLSEFGQLSILVAGVIATLTWARNTLGEVVLASSQGKTSDTARILGESVHLGFVGASLSTVVFVAFGGPPSIGLTALAVLALIPLQDLLRQVAFAQGRPIVSLLGDGLWLSATLAIQCLTLVATERPYALLLFLAWPLGGAVSIVMMSYLLRCRPRLGFHRPVLRTTRASLHVAGANLLGVAATYSATTIVAALLGPFAVGVMRLVAIFMTPANLLISTVPAILLPALRSEPVRGSQQLRALLRQAFVAIGVVSLACAILVVVLLPLFEARMTTSHLVMISAMSAVTALFTFGAVSQYMRLRARNRLGSYARVRTAWSIAYPGCIAGGAATLGLTGAFLGAALAAVFEYILISHVARGPHGSPAN